MNIREALLESKESGQQYMRVGSDGFSGWIRWFEPHTYELNAVDLVADDWVPAADGIEKLTDGKWRLSDFVKED
jgi:hypothetical protein